MSTADAWKGRLRLAAAGLVILAIWLGVLPRLGKLPAVDRRAQLLKQQKIDPAALFYTDLECMADVERHLEAARRRHPEAFWRTSVTPR